jgi:hypothetical protein
MFHEPVNAPYDFHCTMISRTMVSRKYGISHKCASVYVMKKNRMPVPHIQKYTGHGSFSWRTVIE